jgi:serine/threonine protein kinase
MQTGEVLGPYRVLGKLGEGGMGAVYRARDTRLGRDVALKLLAPTFANDPDRVARFAREAQVLASLNHPHVATIYGLEPLAAHQVIVMELVEGETLEARISRGPLDVEHVRRIGIQIADALDAAHERGIVHRDLKPSNVILRPDGTVKVLDFGLAKTQDASKLPSDISASPTMTGGPATHDGIILGTAPYMSPEQARGLAVDRRTDIWALGCLLFESLTGRRAFNGSTLSDTVAVILTGEPKWAEIPASAPPSLIAVIRRCLRKDTRHRMQSAGDVRLELEELDNAESIAGAPTRTRTPWLILCGAAALLVGAVAMFVLANSSRGQERRDRNRACGVGSRLAVGGLSRAEFLGRHVGVARRPRLRAGEIRGAGSRRSRPRRDDARLDRCGEARVGGVSRPVGGERSDGRLTGITRMDGSLSFIIPWRRGL